MDQKEKLIELLDEENEPWFIFKPSIGTPLELGKLLSAVANEASIAGKSEGLVILGIEGETRSIVGTEFNQSALTKGERLSDFLSKNIFPAAPIAFNSVEIGGKRVVITSIQRARHTPIAFQKVRYCRNEEGVTNLERRFDKEQLLWRCLIEGRPTMENTASVNQRPSFNQIKSLSRGKSWDLYDVELKTKQGDFNLLSYCLSDQGPSFRITFYDEDGSVSSSVDFPPFNLISQIDYLIDFASKQNKTRGLEHLQSGKREEVSLFDQLCLSEAIQNAFLHNDYSSLSLPHIAFYPNRIEVESFGPLASFQTKEGLLKGRSMPFNPSLYEAYMAMHPEAMKGEGVKLIKRRLGKKAIEITQDSVKYTIPFNFPLSEKKEEEAEKGNPLTATDIKILLSVKQNPNLSHEQIGKLLGKGKTTVHQGLAKLKKLGYIKRVGSRKTGRWEMLLDVKND